MGHQSLWRHEYREMIIQLAQAREVVQWGQGLRRVLCRAYSAQGFYWPLSWACIGTAGKPADADSDPG